MKIFRKALSLIDVDIIKDSYRIGLSDEYVNKNHSYQIDKIIDYSDIFYCDKTNPFILPIVNKFIQPSEKIYSIHWIEYKEGCSSDKHLDRSSLNTYIILLTDNFTGGDLLVDSVNTNMGMGDIVSFNGSKEHHEVLKVTQGVREVLVVWTRIKETI
jgi:hypothetical protein